MGLFKPRWQNANLQKVTRAVNKLKNQEVLTALVESEGISAVRRAAILRLHNQSSLADLIKNDIGYYKTYGNEDLFRYLVRTRIEAQALLADIAKNAKNRWARFEATLRLTDEAVVQEVLSQLAFSPENDLCMQVAKRLSDQNLAQETYARIAGRATKDSTMRGSRIENSIS